MCNHAESEVISPKFVARIQPQHTLSHMAVRRGFFARLGLACAATAGAIACGNLLGIEQAERVDKPESGHDGGGATIIVTTTEDAGGTSAHPEAGPNGGRRGWVQVYFEVLKNDEAWSPNVRAAKESYQQPTASPPLPFKAAAYSEGALYGSNPSLAETKVGACSVLETTVAGTFTDRPFFNLVEVSSAISPAPLQVKPYQTAANPITVAVNDPSGQIVTFSASNGSVPGFGLRRLVVPRPIVITEPTMVADAGAGRAQVDRTDGLRVRWSGGTGGKVRATVYAMENLGNPVRRVEIFCDAAATAGAIDIPPEALAHLPDPNTLGMRMFFNVQLYSIDEFTSGDYDVTLNVLSPVNPIDTTAVTVTR